MVRAVWNGAVIAESDDTVVVEGNHYFPRSAVQEQYLVPSNHRTVCGWKGIASYYTLVLLHSGGRRRTQPGCRLVLHGALACRRKHPRPDGVLARGDR
nr:DUF427 domain-containing protein [Arthrobacter mobilis]